MDNMLSNPIFGITLTIAAYSLGIYIREKTGSAFANPIVISAVVVILVIFGTPITLEQYNLGGDIIAMFITPATTVLALQIHRRWQLLKENVIPILASCFVGAVTSIVSCWLLSEFFLLDGSLTASLMPKSVTTAIAVDLSEKSGGFGSITASAVVITGLSGALLAPVFVKLFKLKDSVSLGLSLGTSAHALGTTRAFEFGETEGAISGLALTVTGILTSIIYAVFM